jgi:hypothetical protein
MSIIPRWPPDSSSGACAGVAAARRRPEGPLNGFSGRAACKIELFLPEGLMADTSAPITWLHDLDEALEEAGRRDMHVLLDFSAAPL